MLTFYRLANYPRFFTILVCGAYTTVVLTRPLGLSFVVPALSSAPPPIYLYQGPSYVD